MRSLSSLDNDDNDETKKNERCCLAPKVQLLLNEIAEFTPRTMRSNSERIRIAGLQLARSLLATLHTIESLNNSAVAELNSSNKNNDENNNDNINDDNDDHHDDDDDDDDYSMYEQSESNELISKLLPTVHKIWSALVARLGDKSVGVVQKALQTLTQTATVAGNFIASRFVNEAWPRLERLLAGVPDPSPFGGLRYRLTVNCVRALLAVIRHCELQPSECVAIAVAVRRVDAVRWSNINAHQRQHQPKHNTHDLKMDIQQLLSLIAANK